MRDFLCKGYDKLYGFLGYADMQLILGYESGGKGCARISFYYLSGNSLHNYVRGICHHGGEHISEPKLPE